MDGHSGYSDTQTVGLQGLSIRQPRSSTEGAGARTTVALGACLARAPETITSEAIETAEGGDKVAIRLVLDGICTPRPTKSIRIECRPYTKLEVAQSPCRDVLTAVVEWGNLRGRTLRACFQMPVSSASPHGN